MRRYSSPEKRYVTLGLPSFAGTASITDSAVVINLHLSSGKPIYVLNHQPTLDHFFMPMMAMLMPCWDEHEGGGSLVAHLVFGLVLGAVAPYAIPMSLATDPRSRLQDSPKFTTMNFRSVSSVTARLTPSLPIPLILTPPNGALSHRRFVLSLMSTAPAFTFFASLIPRAKFEVKIEACSP